MKNVYVIILLFTYNLGFGQSNLNEPNYIGESYAVVNDVIKPLQKEIAKTTAKARVFVGSKIFLELSGCCSETKINQSNKLKLIVKAVDNKTDPVSIVQIFKFDRKRNKRRVELMRSGLTRISTNTDQFLNFNSEPFGESSYLITIDNLEKDSEYGLIVKNPNSLDETINVINTFSIE